MVASLNSLITVPLTYGADPEERFASSDVSWEDYESLLAKLENNSHYRVSYLDGILEIVSPSRRHEKVKTNLGTLVENDTYLTNCRLGGGFAEPNINIRAFVGFRSSTQPTIKFCELK